MGKAMRGGRAHWSLMVAVLVLGLTTATPGLALFGGGISGGDILAALIAFFEGYLQIQMQNNTDEIVESNQEAADKINEVRIDIFDKETAMKMMTPPNICLTLEVTGASKRADGNIRDVVRSLEHPLLEDITGTENPITYTRERIDRHDADYCSAVDVARGRCDTPGKLPNGDISADVLLSANRYTADEQAAARAFVDHVINPNVELLPELHMENTSQGDALRAAIMTGAARKSLAARSMSEIIAERTPVAGLGGAIGKAEASPQELLFHEVERRFGSPEWADDILKSTPGALARERLLMEAWNMRLQARLYRQQERIETLLAALVAMQAEGITETTARQLRDATQRGLRVR